MNYQALLLAAVFVPVAGAFLLPLAGALSASVRNALAFLLVAASVACSAMLLAPALAGEPIRFSLALPLGLDFAFAADRLAVFMGLVSSTISAIIVLYSFGYIRSYANQNEYYLMVVLFLGAMMGLIFTSNLIWLYVFWEITGIVSWRLIGFFRGPLEVVRADKAFLVTAFGALVMLLGFVSLYAQAGSFNIADIQKSLDGSAVSNLAVVLILFGILSKSATLPFQTWLPDAGVAPSPVTALLHAAVLVKIGVYVYARLFVASFPVEAVWHTVVPVIAGASAILAAGAALIETDLKRIVAYSTVSQIGFIFLGLSLGTGDNRIALEGGLLFILMHGLAKAGLFLCAGIVEHETHTKDITRLGGLAKTMPLTAISFLFCSFSVMGIPPFGGFFSKYMVFAGAAANGNIWITMTFMVGAVMTILYLFRTFNAVFLGEAKTHAHPEGTPIMVASVVTLAALSLLCGIFINPSAHLVRETVQQMLGSAVK